MYVRKIWPFFDPSSPVSAYCGLLQAKINISVCIWQNLLSPPLVRTSFMDYPLFVEKIRMCSKDIARQNTRSDLHADFYPPQLPFLVSQKGIKEG